MRILKEQQSKEIKMALIEKAGIKELIADWDCLSGASGMTSIPLWSLAGFPNIYEECLTITYEAKEIMFKKMKEFLLNKYKTIFIFPADGWIDGITFYNEQDYILKNRPIIEMQTEEIDLIKKAKGLGMQADTYILPVTLSWILFTCHEGFQTLCGDKDFLHDFKKYWTDHGKYIDKKWGEIFKKSE